MNAIACTAGFHRTSVLLLTLLLGPVLTAHAQQAKPPATIQGARAMASEPAAPGRGQLNLNTADVDELTLLPGVGPSRARAIVELRTRMKGFKRIEDIMRVRGIGRKTFRKLKPLLRLQGATTLTEAPHTR
jgi:competence protein ComEA